METTVTQELSIFLRCQVSPESLSSIDDIVLGYIVSVLEQLGEDEQFDVDEFAEIMDAYIPGFDTAKREYVCSWMLDLAEKLVHTTTSSNNHMEGVNAIKNTNNVNLPSSIKGNSSVQESAVIEECQLKLSADRDNFSPSSDRTMCSLNCKSRSQDPGTTDTKSQNIADERKENASERVSVLAEMFPDACSLDIEQCLTITNGDTESAVQLMLLKSERNDVEDKENSKEILVHSPKTHCPSAKRQELQETEQQHLRNQLIARYGYVDVGQDEKTHQPILQKQETKKLFRYRDNQVVSTKGERFSWVKKEQTEDMKKTYVNLKPARKYRFY